MKAIVIEKAGGVDVFQHKDVDAPTPKENEVLINVKAIGINPVDYKVRMIEEVLNMISGPGYPAVLGWDISGDVAAVGSRVDNFKVGDRVFGMVNFPGRGHAYAEQLVSPSDHIAHMPLGLSHKDAAATTLAALTALQVLKSRIGAADRVLIHAGSGGVGHFAIQIAKHMGAHVTTTCSAKNKDFVMGLGAHAHIDYRSEAFEEVAQDMDFVLDGVGGDEMVGKCIKAAKEGGNVVSLPSPQFSEKVHAAAKDKDINLEFILVESNGEDMNTLKEYLEHGVIKPHVSKTFTFDQMDKAHEQLESGRTVGKVVVTM